MLHHVVKMGFESGYFRLNSKTFTENDAGELDGGSGTGIGGESCDVFPGDFGEQQDATDRAQAGDAHAGDDLEILTGDFGDRHETDFSEPGFDLLRAYSGNGQRQIDRLLLRSVEHSPDEGGGIQISDRADAVFSLGGDQGQS